MRTRGSFGKRGATDIESLGTRVEAPNAVGTGKMGEERIVQAIVKQRSRAIIEGQMNENAVALLSV